MKPFFAKMKCITPRRPQRESKVKLFPREELFLFSEIKTGSVAIISLGHRTLSFVYQVAPWARKSKQFPFPGFYGNFKTNKSGYSPV